MSKQIPLTDKALQIMEERMVEALNRGEVIETSNGELATLLVCVLREIRALHTHILDKEAEDVNTDDRGSDTKLQRPFDKSYL